MWRGSLGKKKKILTKRGSRVQKGYTEVLIFAICEQNLEYEVVIRQ